MTQVLFAAVIVMAVLAAGFTEAFFRHVWPLIAEHLRRRIDRDGAASLRSEIADLAARLDRLERGRSREHA